MGDSSAVCSKQATGHALILSQDQRWKYETDEFSGVCEIAHDSMTIRCTFEAVTSRFYDVLEIDKVIRSRLEVPVSVERLSEQLAADFPGVAVTVSGRAATHGWITSGVVHRHF